METAKYTKLEYTKDYTKQHSHFKILTLRIEHTQQKLVWRFGDLVQGKNGGRFARTARNLPENLRNRPLSSIINQTSKLENQCICVYYTLTLRY